MSPYGLVNAEPSELIVENNSTVSFTCNTTAGLSNLYFWLYNVCCVVCDDDCISTTDNFNTLLSGKHCFSNKHIVLMIGVQVGD